MDTDWELHCGIGTAMEPPAGYGTTAEAYMYCGMPAASAETLRVDDLLDFTNLGLIPSSSTSASPAAADASLLPAQEFSAAAASGTAFGFDAVSYPRNSSFTDDIYIPKEEVAELEWLSQFVEESFSNAPYRDCLPEKNESERSRDMGAASSSSSSASEFPAAKGKSNAGCRKKMQGAAEGAGTVDGGVRRCTHCASERTPQWRTGPLGPKTLCNACGVRYKSGRLVPEYRPAASPTFVLTQHSNSHRKVVELRRNKELLTLRRNESGGGGGGGAWPELNFLDYEIC